MAELSQDARSRIEAVVDQVHTLEDQLRKIQAEIKGLPFLARGFVERDISSSSGRNLTEWTAASQKMQQALLDIRAGKPLATPPAPPALLNFRTATTTTGSGTPPAQNSKQAVDALITDLGSVKESATGGSIPRQLDDAIDELRQYLDREEMISLVEARACLQYALASAVIDRKFKGLNRLSGLKRTLEKIIESLCPEAISSDVRVRVGRAMEDVHIVYAARVRPGSDLELTPLAAALTKAHTLLLEIHRVEPGRWPEQLAAAKQAVDQASQLYRPVNSSWHSSMMDEQEQGLRRAKLNLQEALRHSFPRTGDPEEDS